MSTHRTLDYFTEKQQKEMIAYYSNHTAASTKRKFNLTVRLLEALLAKYNIIPHTQIEGETLKHLEKDGYDKFTVEQEKDIVEKYKTMSSTQLFEEIGIKEYYIYYLLEKYGVARHTSAEDRQFTSLYRYGTLYANQSEEIKNKFKTTVLNKSKEEKEASKAKGRKTKLEKYGDENYNNHQKCVETCLERYGVTNVFQDEAKKEKLRQTKLERYGDEKFTNVEKRAKTCLERYGAKDYLSSAAGQESLRKYNNEKYGVDYAFQSAEWQNVVKERALVTKKTNYIEAHGNEVYKEIRYDRDKSIAFIDSQESKTTYDLAMTLGITRDAAYYWLYDLGLLDYMDPAVRVSHYESEIADFIGLDLCKLNDRSILEGREIDIYIPSKKLGIEFNGTYWHSNLKCEDKNYHLEKSMLAEEKGIRLIHIYEYEWNDPIQQEKIKLMLNIALGRVSHKIYARQCEIKQINNTEAKVLNEKVHLQGHRNAQVTYGLFYKSELVQLMSFSRTKYNRNLKNEDSWEIIRGCPGSNNIVVGGVSKLFSHFVKDYSPAKVFSYCDFNKFDGRSYEKLGMQFVGYTGPDMKWLMPDGTVINRSPKHHAELKEAAIGQIFGAGSKKYEMTLR